MLPLRRVHGWRLADAGLLLLVLAATLMPEDWLWVGPPSTFNWIDNADKWLHGFTFTFLAVWFAGQYESKAYWKIGLGLMGRSDSSVIEGLEEPVQATVPSSEGEATVPGAVEDEGVEDATEAGAAEPEAGAGEDEDSTEPGEDTGDGAGQEEAEGDTGDQGGGR